MRRRVARLSRMLELTEAQKTRVETILRGAVTERASLRETERSPERREAMRALRQNTKTQIAGVLTAEQRERFATIRDRRANRRHARRNRRGRRGNGAPMRRGRGHDAPSN